MPTFHEMLKDGPQLGLGIFYPASGIIERIGPDWDWVWIDGQHGELDYSDILAAVRACNLIKSPAVVRVPGHEGGPIGMALDTAADAVMVPMVEDAAQAELIVKAAKFAPLGRRSYGSRRCIDLFSRTYAHDDKPQPLLICQIETKKGLKNANSIAAVEGVDALFVGADDMAMEQQLPMDKPKPKGHFDAALQSVAQAAKTNGKIAGGVFVNEQDISNAVKLGYTLIVSGADVAFLAGGSKEASGRSRKCFGGAKENNNNKTALQQGLY